MRLRIPPPGANRPESKPLMWVGHYAVWFMLASLPVVAYNDWTHYVTQGWIIRSMLGLPGTVATAAIVSDMLEHRWRLCERCARHTPLDGAQAAQRWRWALWLTHSKVIHFCFGILPALLLWHLLQRDVPWFYWVLDFLFFVVVAVIFAATRKHHALYAWCPRCDWGGGGKKEPSPEVSPTPSPDLIGS